MATATDALQSEHKVIQKMVAIMAQLVEQLEMRHPVKPDILRDLLQFMREYSSQCHEAKEESYFFPYLEQKGVPSTGCPLSALRGEHAMARQLIQHLGSAAASYINEPDTGRLTLIQVLKSLVSLYPAHIWKEDYLLFPMAEKILFQKDHDSLLQQFEIAERDLGTDAHAFLEKLVGDLAQRIDQCPQCAHMATR